VHRHLPVGIDGVSYVAIHNRFLFLAGIRHQHKLGGVSLQFRIFEKKRWWGELVRERKCGEGVRNDS
jgi:hypothetical protein